jgi:CheY-like chemotaxis protein
MPNGGSLLIAAEKRHLAPGELPQIVENRSAEFICLSLMDTGVGVPAEHLPKIFDPFFTTKEIGKGTGLGLATVCGVMKQHNGWIDVRSTVGRGTTFTLYFVPSESPAETQRENPPAKSLEAHKGSVLLVEDDQAVRRLASYALTRAGYSVMEAASGPSALTLADEHPKIDLLISDVIMPEGMTGADLAEKIKERYPHIPVILTSGYSDFRGRPMRLPKGATFLPKPYSKDVFLQTVSSALASARTEPAAELASITGN